MPNSGDYNTPAIGERLLPVPIWVTGLLFLLAAAGLVSMILVFAKIIARALSRRI